jgi:hypothetical protein
MRGGVFPDLLRVPPCPHLPLLIVSTSLACIPVSLTRIQDNFGATGTESLHLPESWVRRHPNNALLRADMRFYVMERIVCQLEPVLCHAAPHIDEIPVAQR